MIDLVLQHKKHLHSRDFVHYSCEYIVYVLENIFATVQYDKIILRKRNRGMTRKRQTFSWFSHKRLYYSCIFPLLLISFATADGNFERLDILEFCIQNTTLHRVSDREQVRWH